MKLKNAVAIMFLMAGTGLCADVQKTGVLDKKTADTANQPAVASHPGKPAIKDVMAEIDAMAEIDVIDKETLDLDARYWAWRIKGYGDVTYYQMLEYSKNWIMSFTNKAQLMRKIKEILDGGEVRKLNKDEMAKLDGAKEKIRAILAPASRDKKLIAALSVDYCINLKARYWAGRVQQGEKEILNSMHKWPLSDGDKQKLISRITENLKHENAPLSKDELYKLDACIEKLK